MSLLQRLAKALRIGKARYIVGHDLAGNSYLELPSLSGSLDPRHTRRSIQWKDKRELGDYDQRSIPVQWVMWLRHTRREAPTIQELVRDRERILLTQANAAKLALEDQASRQNEQQARLEQHNQARHTAEQESIHTSSTRPDQDVWAASRARARLATKAQLEPQSAPPVSESLQHAMDPRAAARAAHDHDQAERQRARSQLSKSPLEAFVPMPKPTR